MANLSLGSVKEGYESMKEGYASVKESMKEIMQPYTDKVQPYARVLAARAKNRPTSQRFIAGLTEDFLEFHGDRRFGDDAAIIAGVARIHDMPVTVIGIEKGITLQESIRRNFGAAHPEGYRKALRLMKQAEKFHRPVLCIVDTSGAYCGIGAEERGQGQAIAENLMEMMTLKTPVISLLIGGRKRGSAGISRCRSGMDDGKLHLFGYLAGRLRQHPVEGFPENAGGSRASQTDCTGFTGTGCNRTGYSGKQPERVRQSLRALKNHAV